MFDLFISVYKNYKVHPNFFQFTNKIIQEKTSLQTNTQTEEKIPITYVSNYQSNTEQLKKYHPYPQH